MTTGILERPTAESDRWRVPQDYDATFSSGLDGADQTLLRLYARGKKAQWDASGRLDWSIDVDPENPAELPDETLPLFGSVVYDRMSPRERARVRHHFQAWQFSQFMYGEEGALLCAAKVAAQSESAECKLFAATQVVDEARHYEAFSRLLREKYELVYPVNASVKSLLSDVLADSRWDMTYLGMQVMVEGLALAAFAQLRDCSANPLVAAVNAYVMQDEVRHVAFGRIVLRDVYPQLSEAERRERQEFVIEALHFMRDRFEATEVWERLGLPADDCARHMKESGVMEEYHGNLFSRIVPIVREIGLLTPRVAAEFDRMGVLGFGDLDVAEVAARDERAAREFDARRAEIRTVADRAAEDD